MNAHTPECDGLLYKINTCSEKFSVGSSSRGKWGSSDAKRTAYDFANADLLI